LISPQLELHRDASSAHLHNLKPGEALHLGWPAPPSHALIPQQDERDALDRRLGHPQQQGKIVGGDPPTLDRRPVCSNGEPVGFLQEHHLRLYL
jgi:hypothetical protein